MTTKIDARNITTSYVYDASNRFIQRNDTNEPSVTETPDVAYTYKTTAPGIGNLIKLQSSVSTTEYTAFDILGRVTEHKQTTDGVGYETGYAYNLSGALVEQTYPSGRVVKNVLDASGDLSMVQSARCMDAGLEAKLVENPRIVVSKVKARYSLRRNLNFGELVSSDAVKSFVYLL